MFLNYPTYSISRYCSYAKKVMLKSWQFVKHQTLILMNKKFIAIFISRDKASKERKFAYDKSYWSHDGFVTDPISGYQKAQSPASNYADQVIFRFTVVSQQKTLITNTHMYINSPTLVSRINLIS